MSTEENSSLQPVPKELNQERRTWVVAASALGGVAGASIVFPLVNSFAPSEKAKAAGAPVEVDIAGMQPGEMRTSEWRGKPIWVVRRTPEQLADLKKNDANLADPNSLRGVGDITPKYAQNEWRSIKPEYLVVVGICTHLGCSPSAKLQSGAQPSLPADWQGGFLCPCHGSTFDLAARVFKNKPAPDNLPVPPHTYLSDTKILIGEDQKA
jgi:ubiquinol-cytochrome c reductase iron-sulfur subunit